MAHRVKLVICAFALSPLGAFAFYQSPTPPPGFGGTAGNWTYKPPTGTEQIDKIMRQSGSAGLRVPTAPPVTLPVAYRLRAIAGRVAAAAVYATPALRLAIGVAAWLGVSKVVYDEVNKTWHETGEPGQDEIKQYRYQSNPWTSLSGACNQALSAQNTSDAGTGYTSTLKSCQPGVAILARKGPFDTVDYPRPLEERTIPATGECPPGWTPSGAGCLSPALDKPAFERLLDPDEDPSRMPSTVPGEIGVPLPVEAPIVNPSPGASPQPRPIFVPTGDPVPNPEYDPSKPVGPNNQPYMQPGVRVVPSPTVNDPWRVDVQPVNRPSDSSQPLPDPVTENPEVENSDKPKPEEQQSLCEKHPDVVACAKLGAPPEAQPVPNEDRQLSIQPDTGWGEGSGSCPAPKTVQVHGFQLSMPFDLLCDFASGIRPVVIGLAWLAAAFTFMGIGRRD